MISIIIRFLQHSFVLQTLYPAYKAKNLMRCLLIIQNELTEVGQCPTLVFFLSKRVFLNGILIIHNMLLYCRVD